MSKTPETDLIFATKHNRPPTHLIDEMRRMEIEITELKEKIEFLKETVKLVKKTKDTKAND